MLQARRLILIQVKVRLFSYFEMNRFLMIQYFSDPPTYEEAIASEGGGSNNFKPKYPMFRRQTSYSIENS